MRRKYTFNECYFDKIDTEEKSYWLGFFFADGCVRKNTFSCVLKSDDDYHLSRFLGAIDANNVSLKYRDTAYNTRSVGFWITSEHMVKMLNSMGFVERKTYVNSEYIFTRIPEELKIHFIRGYWDGNGCVKLRQNRFGDIGVVCLNEKLLTAFTEYFNNRAGDNRFSKVFKDINGYFRIVICGEKAKTVCNWFYENCTVCLDRKYKKYLQFKTYTKNYRGIRQRKSGRYQVYIKVNYKQITFGTYDTIREAVDVYNTIAPQYNLPKQRYYGESLLRSKERIA